MTKELGEILSGEPAQVEQSSAELTPEITPEVEPQQPEPAVGAEPEPQPERVQGMVPQRALHASRERARTAEERLADLERENAELRGQNTVFAQQRQQPQTPQPVVEPPKPVDFWEDPNKFVESALTPLQQELAETRFVLSRQSAVASVGMDGVTAAEAALKEAIERGEVNGDDIGAQLRKSRDPVGDVVRWHQNSPAVREAALREQIRAELLAEQQGTQPEAIPAAPAPVTPSVMPSNLAGARNVGNRSGPAWSGPKPLSDIFSRGTAKAG